MSDMAYDPLDGNPYDLMPGEDYETDTDPWWAGYAEAATILAGIAALYLGAWAIA